MSLFPEKPYSSGLLDQFFINPNEVFFNTLFWVEPYWWTLKICYRCSTSMPPQIPKPQYLSQLLLSYKIFQFYINRSGLDFHVNLRMPRGIRTSQETSKEHVFISGIQFFLLIASFPTGQQAFIWNLWCSHGNRGLGKWHKSQIYMINEGGKGKR